jgi:hypothetical protein
VSDVLVHLDLLLMMGGHVLFMMVKLP